MYTQYLYIPKYIFLIFCAYQTILLEENLIIIWLIDLGFKVEYFEV